MRIRRKTPYLSAVIVGLVGAVMTVACGGAAIGGSATKASQGITDKEIHLGTVLPLTGGAAPAGQGIQAGLLAAVGEVNATGGINGRQINLTVLDDHFDAATHVANFRRLVEQDKIFAMLVPAGSANLPGNWPFVEQTGVPVFGPYLPPDPNLKSVFMLGTGHEDQARVLTDFFAQKGVKTVGFIGQDNDLGTSMLNGLKTQAAKDGIQIVSQQTVQPNSTNISSAVVNLREAKPDAVLFAVDSSQSVLLLKQAKQLGWHPTFGGDSSTAGTNSPATLGAAGDAAEGLYGTYFAASPADTGSDVAAWKAATLKYAQNGSSWVNNSFALQSYAFSKVFFKILKSMGSDLTWSNFDKQAEALHGFNTGLLPPVTFGPLPAGHSGTSGAKVAQVQSGAWQPVTPDWLLPKK